MKCTLKRSLSEGDLYIIVMLHIWYFSLQYIYSDVTEKACPLVLLLISKPISVNQIVILLCNLRFLFLEISYQLYVEVERRMPIFEFTATYINRNYILKSKTYIYHLIDIQNLF